MDYLIIAFIGVVVINTIFTVRDIRNILLQKKLAEVKTKTSVSAANELIKKQGYVIYVDQHGKLIAQDPNVIIKVDGLVTHPQTLLIQYQGELINANEHD